MNEYESIDITPEIDLSGLDKAINRIVLLVVLLVGFIIGCLFIALS